MSDYFLVEVRLKVMGRRRSAGRIESVRNVFKVNELGLGRMCNNTMAIIIPVS